MYGRTSYVSNYEAAARDSESGLVRRSCPFVSLSVCLSDCRQNAKKMRFSQKLSTLAMVSIDDL